MAEKTSFNGWLSFWKSLDYGPKGSLIGLVLALIVLIGPSVLKLILYILLVVLCMAIGGLIGALIGWIFESRKSSGRES